MGVYAQNNNNTFHTGMKVRMTRKRGGALERRIQRIRGGKLVIHYDSNTFEVVRKEEKTNDQ